MAAGSSAPTLALVARQEVKTELGLVRKDLEALVAGMRAAEQRLRSEITNLKMWEWLIDSETVCSVLQNFGAILKLSDWILKAKEVQNKLKHAARHELEVSDSRLFLCSSCSSTSACS